MIRYQKIQGLKSTSRNLKRAWLLNRTDLANGYLQNYLIAEENWALTKLDALRRKTKIFLEAWWWVLASTPSVVWKNARQNISTLSSQITWRTKQAKSNSASHSLALILKKQASILRTPSRPWSRRRTFLRLETQASSHKTRTRQCACRKGLLTLHQYYRVHEAQTT